MLCDNYFWTVDFYSFILASNTKPRWRSKIMVRFGRLTIPQNSLACGVIRLFEGSQLRY